MDGWVPPITLPCPQFTHPEILQIGKHTNGLMTLGWDKQIIQNTSYLLHVLESCMSASLLSTHSGTSEYIITILGLMVPEIEEQVWSIQMGVMLTFPCWCFSLVVPMPLGNGTLEWSVLSGRKGRSKLCTAAPCPPNGWHHVGLLLAMRKREGVWIETNPMLENK